MSLQGSQPEGSQNGTTTKDMSRGCKIGSVDLSLYKDYNGGLVWHVIVKAAKKVDGCHFRAVHVSLLMVNVEEIKYSFDMIKTEVLAWQEV